jgi:gamma-carbonic anhydrase
VLAADGGPVEVGANCVIMEHAVLRGTLRHPLTIGDHVLARPRSYVTGCTVGDEAFIATGAMVFNGAQMGRASSVVLGGAIHIGCVVPPQTRIPIGWVAAGDAARLYPPGEADSIRAGLEAAGGFLPFVFGTDPAVGRGEQMRTAMRRYASFLSRSRSGDEPIGQGRLRRDDDQFDRATVTRGIGEGLDVGRPDSPVQWRLPRRSGPRFRSTPMQIR